MNRHIQNIHDGDDEPEEENSDTGEVIEFPAVVPYQKLEIIDILKDLNLENLLENFESQGVDLDMLVSLDKLEFQNCIKNWNYQIW